MTLCHFFIKQKSLKASDLNGFQAFYSSQVSKTGIYHICVCQLSFVSIVTFYLYQPGLMRKLVIRDIHGNFDKFMDLLKVACYNGTNGT